MESPNYFDKYKVDQHGDYDYAYEGIHYQDIEDLLGGRMKFCGCGSPGGALLYVLRVLEHFSKQHEDRSYEDLKALFSSEGEMFFVLYMLDSHRFLEHGSSVMGSWITPEGQEYLTDLREYKKLVDSGEIEG